MIGSVDVINDRISSLNSELSLYESKLAIESQASHNDDVLALSRRKTPFKTTRSARGIFCLMHFYRSFLHLVADLFSCLEKAFKEL